jgi:predicted ABC-type ATPase
MAEASISNGPKPILWLIAGANGVGKTTYARDHIQSYSGTKSFVNLDEIARGLSPFEPEAQRVRAARVSLNYLYSVLDIAAPETGDLDNRKSISLETTLAGLTHLRTIDRAKANGWRVHLLYFAVSSPEVALARIARRVSEGGHDIPESDARRRFKRSIENFGLYSLQCDLWRVFDNNGKPKVVAEGHGPCRSYLNFEKAVLPSNMAETLQALPLCAEM